MQTLELGPACFLFALFCSGSGVLRGGSDYFRTGSDILPPGHAGLCQKLSSSTRMKSSMSTVVPCEQRQARMGMEPLPHVLDHGMVALVELASSCRLQHRGQAAGTSKEPVATSEPSAMSQTRRVSSPSS